MSTLIKGDRVVVSEEWLNRSYWARKSRRVRGGKWYSPDRLGTVLATPKRDAVQVRWDGNARSSISVMHFTFLRKVGHVDTL